MANTMPNPYQKDLDATDADPQLKHKLANYKDALKAGRSQQYLAMHSPGMRKKLKLAWGAEQNFEWFERNRDKIPVWIAREKERLKLKAERAAKKAAKAAAKWQEIP
jgi:hypothetical protein